MKVTKFRTHELDKCYAIAPLQYNGHSHILVAAEKQNRCLLFTPDGELEETVWSEPGGTMSMVQVPGSDGVFLATHKFYSPNDSKEAKIVIVTPKGKDDWEVRTLVEIPFVHRFDILQSDGRCYLIACTLKSGHECKDDWSMPGKIWVAELPKDLSGYDEEHQLALTCIRDGLLKNHGYCKIREDSGEWSLVAADNGVFRVVPPCADTVEWQVETLLTEAASDAVLADLDGDGEKEMLTIAPFHGDAIKIYRKQENGYQLVYTCDRPTEFGHAIWKWDVGGKDVVIIGHRKGDRDLMVFFYDQKTGNYTYQVLDHDVGPANVYCYRKDEEYRIVAANRETNEIAFYAVDR